MRRGRTRKRASLSSGLDRVPGLVVVAGLALLGFLTLPFLSLLSALRHGDLASLRSRETVDALRTTLIAASVAIVADGMLGIPLGLWAARGRSRLRHLVTAAVLLPLAVPPVVGGLELLLWLGPRGWLGSHLDHLGLNPLDSLAGTILAQMFVAAPFVVISARAALSSVEPGIIDAARSLGSGPVRTVVRVMLPSARRGIAAGLVLGWLRAVGEFGASAVVAYHPYTLATLTYVNLSGQGLRTALPSGALLAGFGAAAALILLLLDTFKPRSGPGRMDASTGDVESRLDWVKPPGSGPDGRLAVSAAGGIGDFELEVGFDVPAGSIGILGPSGAGKSLTLRTIAGLLRPGSGAVVLAGRVFLDTGRGVEIPPEQRNIGYVAQNDSLFHHLDVEGNIGFALRGLNRSERAKRVGELLNGMGLADFGKAHTRTLSGGQRQRVALARALAAGPSALLLDEPFSSLDSALRRELRGLVREVHDRTGLPMVLVTHDREDALDLADYLIVMDQGKVVQQGAIEDVFARPASRVVARLLGVPNVVAVRALRPGGGGTVASTDWGEVAVQAPDNPEGTWELSVPAEAIGLRWGEGSGIVLSARPSEGHWRVLIRHVTQATPLEALVARSDSDPRPAPGTLCDAVLHGARCHLMRRLGTERN